MKCTQLQKKPHTEIQNPKIFIYFVKINLNYRIKVLV